MNILALDLGEHTGWSTVKPALTSTIDVVRMDEFWNWLNHFKGDAFDLILYENAFRQPGQASAQFNKRLGVLECFCEKYKIPYIGIGVSTWQSWLNKTLNLGLPKPNDISSAAKRRKIRKEKILLAARSESGLTVPDDNAADAYWVLQYYLNNQDKYEGITS